jgi:small-conductance mechanosensitive channel
MSTSRILPSLPQHARIISVLALTLACGCASQKSSTDRASAQASPAQKDSSAAEAAENREFIAQAQARLDALGQTTDRIEDQLRTQADAAEQAVLGERLFELRQAQTRVRSELQNLERAPADEWAPRHVELTRRIDALASSVAQVDRVRTAESGAERARVAETAGAAVNLCALQVDGAEAAVHQQGEMLVVIVTAPNSEAIEEIQERAESVTHGEGNGAAGTPANSSPPASAGQDTASAAPLVVDYAMEDVPDGVIFVFQPAEGQLGALRTELERHAQQVEDQSC